MAPDETSPRKPHDPPWRSRTARRGSTRAAMTALRGGRLRRGWSITRAAAKAGISRAHLSLLERGLRRPSESVADDIVAAYGMTEREAAAVRAVAVPWAGRDSPYRTGIAPGGHAFEPPRSGGGSRMLGPRRVPRPEPDWRKAYAAPEEAPGGDEQSNPWVEVYAASAAAGVQDRLRDLRASPGRHR